MQIKGKRGEMRSLRSNPLDTLAIRNRDHRFAGGEEENSIWNREDEKRGWVRESRQGRAYVKREFALQSLVPPRLAELAQNMTPTWSEQEREQRRTNHSPLNSLVTDNSRTPVSTE